MQLAVRHAHQVKMHHEKASFARHALALWTKRAAYLTNLTGIPFRPRAASALAPAERGQPTNENGYCAPRVPHVCLPSRLRFPFSHSAPHASQPLASRRTRAAEHRVGARRASPWRCLWCSKWHGNNCSQHTWPAQAVLLTKWQVRRCSGRPPPAAARRDTRRGGSSRTH